MRLSRAIIGDIYTLVHARYIQGWCMIQGHTIQLNPHFISNIIGVLVLNISASSFSDILEPPSLE
jgi:hypothetical protein